MPSPLRILIAEDSELFAQVLEELLSGEPDIEVIATVDNGEDAVHLCGELSPDLVVMDIHSRSPRKRARTMRSVCCSSSSSRG